MNNSSNGKKICLYGAFGRHNFGDLLFPHIVEKLLKDKFNTSNIIFCDILERDMRKYGGHFVESITSIFNKNKDTDVIIMVGGEICNCTVDYALYMFEPKNNDIVNNHINLLKNKIKDPVYLIDNNLLENKNTICIANSIGGTIYNNKLANNKLLKYKYVSTRDSLNKNKLFDISPDCAVITKYFYDEKINNFKKDFKFMKNKYIAIQINNEYLQNINFNTLDEISKYLKIPIYFFVAGTASGHDSIEKYVKIINKNKNFYIFNESNIWKICCLIANSYIVIGTSLHVRIISFCYSKIRFTLTNNTNCNKSKHYQFINRWDNIKNSFIKYDNLFNAIKFYTNNNNEKIFYDDKNLNQAMIQYITNTKKWLNIISS